MIGRRRTSIARPYEGQGRRGKGRADEDIGPYEKERNQARDCVAQRRRDFSVFFFSVPPTYARVRGKRDGHRAKTIEPPVDHLVEAPKDSESRTAFKAVLAPPGRAGNQVS